MNINEIYERLKEQNKDIIELLENELSTLDKDKVFDATYEKKIKRIIKKYNTSLKIKYEVDMSFRGKNKIPDKMLGLMIIIINKNFHLKIEKTINTEEKTVVSFFNNKELESFNVVKDYLKFNSTIRDKNSVLNGLLMSIKVNKEDKFLLDYMRHEWSDYLGGNNFNKKQTVIYLKIKEIVKNYDIDFLKLLLNDKEEIGKLKESIELEKLMDDSTVLEDFFVKTKMIGKLKLNDFIIGRNESLVQTLIKTKNKIFSKN